MTDTNVIKLVSIGVRWGPLIGVQNAPPCYVSND